MRNRAFVAVALLAVVSSDALAQRGIGIRGGSRRPGVAELPERQPEAVARASAVNRSRFSFESYPLLSYVDGSSLSSGLYAEGWSSLGSGVRAEYRGTSSILATLDMTSTFLGGQVSTQTVELGGRYRPREWEHAIRPYVDLRAAYMQSGGMYTSSNSFSAPFGAAPTAALGIQHSRGIGGVVGAGGEFWITSRFALTSGVSAVRSHMTSYRYSTGTQPSDANYTMTTYRLTVGLRFNQIQNFTQAR